MARISDEMRDRLRAAANLVDVVARYAPDVRRAGSAYKCRCPLPDHDEKTASFSVDAARGLWHCFGCSRGGDVFDFVAHVEGFAGPRAFRDAAEFIADLVGIHLEVDRDSDERDRKVAAMRSAVAATSATYQQHLNDPEAAAARKYLRDRGFDAAAVEKFAIGWAPTGQPAVLRDGGLSSGQRDAALACKLLRTSRSGGRIYDPYAGRLTWTLFDRQGRPVGIAGRTLESASDVQARGGTYRKYVNSDDSDLFHKSDLLYGFHWARASALATQTLYVVEGYTDLMAMHAVGFVNTVALCGTAFTVQQSRLISGVVGGGDGHVVVLTDNDDAGLRAAQAVFEKCQEFATVHVVQWPGEKDDPCSLRSEHGDEALREIVLNPVPWLRARIETIAATADRSPEDRAAAARRVLEVLRGVSDPVLRSEYAAAAERHMQLPQDSITSRLVAAAADRRSDAVSRTSVEHPAEHAGMTPAERRLLSKALVDATAFQTLVANPRSWTPAAQRVWDACLEAAELTAVGAGDWLHKVVEHLDSALTHEVTGMVLGGVPAQIAVDLQNQVIESSRLRLARITAELAALDPDTRPQDAQRVSELTAERNQLMRRHAEARQARRQYDI